MVVHAAKRRRERIRYQQTPGDFNTSPRGDGRVIASHFPTSNGATMAAAPAMTSLLRELVAGAPPEKLRERAELILRQIDRARRVSRARTTSNFHNDLAAS